MALSRDHHFISRLVLRRFSADGKHTVALWKPKRVGDPEQCYSRMPISGTSMRRNFNIVELMGPAGTDALEFAVSRAVEAPAADALRSVDAAPVGRLALTVTQRRALCNLAGILHANSPEGRARFQSIVDILLPQLRGGASPAQVTQVAQAAAFDRTDPAEVAAWQQIFSDLMRGGNVTRARHNLERLTLLWGQMQGQTLQKMAVTVYRIDQEPLYVLPDLPVLGKAFSGGDLPDPGSFAMFPADPHHLLVFDADAQADEIRLAHDPRLVQLLRRHFPAAPPSLTSSWHWEVTLAWTSRQKEFYALRVEDVKAARRVAAPTAGVMLRSVPSHPGPGIVLT
jgi:hypothetical protein